MCEAAAYFLKDGQEELILENVDQFETEQPTAGGKRYGEHDDDGIDKIPEQRGHQ